MFFDLSPEAGSPLDLPGWAHCPGLILQGIIISLSFPDPAKPYKNSPAQQASKPGSLGMLLPGFCHTLRSDRILITGPAAGPEGILLPPGSSIDSGGFVFLP